MNVLVIVVDTLRADHLGCYGYARNTSPNIDALARQSVLFERAFAPAIPTHPAFVTLGTGQYSITHGVVAHGGPGEALRSGPWLPALMQSHGYTTCAVDNLAWWRRGFARGYEFCIDPAQKKALSIACDNRQICRRVVEWLEHHRDERFFLWVHFWDPHTPYLPPRAYRTLFYSGNPYDTRNHSLEGMETHPLGRTWRDTWFNKLGGHVTDAEYIEALYDGEIRYCDEGIGRLLNALESAGLADNTCVAVLSDHGEMMCRHGIFFDHHGLYDGNVHIPFLLRIPGAESRRIPDMVEHVDVAPTILDLCGIAIPEEMEGVSLAPLVRGECIDSVRDFVVCQECTWQMKWAIRTDRYKFILAREQDFYGTPMRELYDLQADPDELNNIADEAPEVAQALEVQLEGWIARKMAYNALTEDPLVAHGLTLGMRWKQERGNC